MKKLVLGISFALVAVITISAVQSVDLGGGSKIKNDQAKINPSYHITSLPIPDDLNFSGEVVPIESPDIYERFDNELLSNVYFQSNAIKLIKKAHRYFPIIEPILADHGIPEDFKYLAVAESGLTNAVSPAGAKGFWQLMPDTARELGMEVNDNVDERYNLEISTRAAAAYLKESKKKFGTWTLAAAAYNAGNAGINREQVRQSENGYYDLLLNTETSRYVFRILALKSILERPQLYGFEVLPEHFYPSQSLTALDVDYEIEDLVKFAKDQGINYKTLKFYNPWLRETKLNNKSGKMYSILIPRQESNK